MPTAINYLQAFRVEAWPKLVFNSSIIALSSVSIALIVGVPAAYSFAMYRYRGKAILTLGLLALKRGIRGCIPVRGLRHDYYAQDRSTTRDTRYDSRGTLRLCCDLE